MSDWLSPNPPHIAEPLSISDTKKEIKSSLIFEFKIQQNGFQFQNINLTKENITFEIVN